LLLSIALVVGVVGYLAVDHVARLRGAPTSRTVGKTLPAPTPPVATPPVAPPSATPAAAESNVELKKTYDACVMKLFPTREDAEARAAACSKALQTRQLAPDQVAMARLTRGIARTALGDRILASEDYAAAVQHYDQLINPANPDSLSVYRRAVALDASGQTDRALDEYGNAIKLDPKASLAFLSRGVLLAARRRAYDRAIEDFDRVLVLEPDNLEALVARGDAFSQLKDDARAMADLNRAVTLAPGNAVALIARGQAESRRGNQAEAQRDYEAALKANPRNVTALVNLAAVNALRGDVVAAIPLLDRAIEIDSGDPLAFYNRGYAHFRLKQYDKALADYSAAIDLDRTLGLAFNNRALTRVVLDKELKAALDDADEALRLMPINLDVRETRGFIFLKLNEPAQALVNYDAALALDPNRALALYGRGLSRLRMGDSGGKADQQAADLGPGFPQAYGGLGLAAEGVQPVEITFQLGGDRAIFGGRGAGHEAEARAAGGREGLAGATARHAVVEGLQEQAVGPAIAVDRRNAALEVIGGIRAYVAVQLDRRVGARQTERARQVTGLDVLLAEGRRGRCGGGGLVLLLEGLQTLLELLEQAAQFRGLVGGGVGRSGAHQQQAGEQGGERSGEGGTAGGEVHGCSP